jgi:hypothetical protein
MTRSRGTCSGSPSVYLQSFYTVYLTSPRQALPLIIDLSSVDQLAVDEFAVRRGIATSRSPMTSEAKE